MPTPTKITFPILVALAMLAAWVQYAQAALPSDDNQIIATISVNHPANTDRAEDGDVDALIQQGKQSGDQRYFGYAEAELNRHPDPADKNWLLKKIYLLQQRHDFEQASSMLSALMQREPADTSLAFTQAILFSMLGRYLDAQHNCTRAASALAAVTYLACMTQATAAETELNKRVVALEKLLAADTEAHVWERALLADAQVRLGNSDKAEQNYLIVLTENPLDYASRLALADLYLDQQRWHDAQNLTMPYAYLDSMLLRLAVAARHLTPQNRQWEKQISERFSADSATVSADQLYFLTHWPQRAASPEQLALALFQNSKSPVDIALACAAISSAKNASPIVAWLQLTHYYDKRITLE
ncbi:MAG TPA: hypothetical protein VFM46_11345 [Pseudomonadales bacterium]|nr:hypothetical protein [Pseudomonadales bacterium]